MTQCVFTILLIDEVVEHVQTVIFKASCLEKIIPCFINFVYVVAEHLFLTVMKENPHREKSGYF